MQNNQQPESFIDQEFLEVHSIFATIQGEGPFAGRPATFIRLAGCNLQCPMCDTDYTSRRDKMRIQYIVEDCRNYGLPLIIITGGEPFRQNLFKLIRNLLEEKFTVQVETNGTLPPPMQINWGINTLSPRPSAFIVCAPKTGSIHKDIFNNSCAFKYVVRAHECNPENGLPYRVLDHPTRGIAMPCPRVPVYISPADENDPVKNKQNLREAIQSCMTQGYILSLQIHKIIKMP
jgi:7-carboxy-7-deazaguanine synthase